MKLFIFIVFFFCSLCFSSDSIDWKLIQEENLLKEKEDLFKDHEILQECLNENKRALEKYSSCLQQSQTRDDRRRCVNHAVAPAFCFYAKTGKQLSFKKRTKKI